MDELNQHGPAQGGDGGGSERRQALENIDALAVRIHIQGLPEQTSSLLESSITLQQFRVLLHVYARGPVPIHGVAQTLGFKANVATGVVQRLVDRGLIHRCEDPSDRRARLLTVTDHGKALIEEMGAAAQVQRRRILERLSDVQLRQLEEILTALTS